MGLVADALERVSDKLKQKAYANQQIRANFSSMTSQYLPPDMTMEFVSRNPAFPAAYNAINAVVANTSNFKIICLTDHTPYFKTKYERVKWISIECHG